MIATATAAVSPHRAAGVLALVVAAHLHACVSSGGNAPPTPAAPDAAPARKTAARLADRDGLRRVARIAPGLLRGAQPTAEGYRELRGMGVKTVISFRRFHSGERDAIAAGLAYVSLPIHAGLGSEAPSAEQVRRFLEIVRDPARQPVFIHCKNGEDRTGAMTAIYRMTCERWPKEEAIAEMDAFGFHRLFVDLYRFVADYRCSANAAGPETTENGQSP